MTHCRFMMLFLTLIAFLCHGEPVPSPVSWTSLFDGDSLGEWEETAFGGVDEVRAKDGIIELDMPNAEMTGITWKGYIPRMSYEVELEAMRVRGNDFFCCLTFPVRDSCCSLVVGGWGGNLVGLSSIDDLDASENETTLFQEFETKRWYRIRVRVSPSRIRAWIDDKQVIDADIKGRKISVRYECENSRPLGVSSWHTQAALRNIRFRKLTVTEVEKESALIR